MRITQLNVYFQLKHFEYFYKMPNQSARTVHPNSNKDIVFNYKLKYCDLKRKLRFLIYVSNLIFLIYYHMIL